MTNRRSLQSAAARQSRQTQFVPGHVGGRVASAQPVRSRRAVGAAGASPLALESLYRSRVYYEASYGDGNIYPLPQTRAISLSTTGLGAITGKPCIAIIQADGWKTITPAAGWTKVLEHTNGHPHHHTVAVWTIDAYAGESLTGDATNYYSPGIAGFNFRLDARLLVGGTRGRFTATLGTPSTSIMTLADPGGTFRLQYIASQVRYDYTWTPTLPATMGRGGNINSGQYFNGAIDGDTAGWYSESETAAIMTAQTIGSGNYAPSVTGSNIPVNIIWTG